MAIGIFSQMPQSDRSRVIARLIAIVVICAMLAVAPFLGMSEFNLFLLTKGLALALWAIGLDLLVGYTGLLSFGHSAWLGLGAYAAGYVAREYTTDIFVTSLSVIVVVGVVAGTVGFIATRVSGVAFAIVTLAIAASIHLVIVRLPPEFVGGRSGLFGVPAPSVFGRPIEYGQEFYYLTCVLTVIVVLALRYFVNTPFGRVLQAIRDNEARAKAIGVNVPATRWMVFVLSAIVSGLGGMMLCFLQGGMSTLEFQWVRSADVLIMLLLGGLGTIYGPVVGAIFFTFAFTTLISWWPREWQIYLGLVFLAVLMFMPGGFAGGFERIRKLVWPKL